MHLFRRTSDRTEVDKYRILLVFSTLSVGGAETWLMALLRYFNDVKGGLPFRIEFDICITSGNKGVFDDEAVALGVRLFYLRYSRNSLFRFVRKFRRILADGNYDAIHDHQDYTSGLHFLFGLGYLPAVRIAHIHTTFIHIENYSSTFARRLTIVCGKNLLAHLATHIIGTSWKIVSEYGFDERRFDRVKRDVVHCGFNVLEFYGGREVHHDAICKEFGWNKSVKIVLFVGRLEPLGNPKNPEFALEVARLCVKNDLSVCFLMVGAVDSVRKTLEEQVSLWGGSNSIRFLGVRADIPHLMLGSNLLLFPSIAEGLGMVAVEAQAAGLRVLASDTVPKECQAINGMITSLPLDAGAETWTKKALELVQLPFPDLSACNEAVKRSSFSIENSAAALLDIYVKGTR
jgi:glycosyltransferase involved in cell wall biosynthesis